MSAEKSSLSQKTSSGGRRSSIIIPILQVRKQKTRGFFAPTRRVSRLRHRNLKFSSYMHLSIFDLRSFLRASIPLPFLKVLLCTGRCGALSRS